MVIVLSPDDINVQRDSSTLSETLQYVGDHLCAQVAKFLSSEHRRLGRVGGIGSAEVGHEKGPVREVDYGAGKGFVEGSVSRAKASEASGGFESLFKGLP